MGEDVEISVTETTNIIEITPQPNDQIIDIGVIDNAPNVDVNVTPSVIEINVTRGSSTAIWGSITGNLTDQGDLVSTLALKADLVAGKVPSSQLPSYVDDIIEVANFAALPTTGETGKIYITIDNNHIFRWTGSTYVEITDNTAVWGAITGTLSSQSDLQSALNSKFNNPTGNTTQYIAGDGSLITFPISGQAGTIVREVRNTTGATLTKGTIVYISGATGNKPTVSKAIATGDSTSAQTFGFVQADIANNANGYIVTIGDLIGLDTSAITEGTQLYLSSTTAGTYTTTKQIAPAHLVYVGVVTRSHPTQGQIEVKVQNGYELDEIHDVLITSKTNKDFLNYDSASGLWKNKSLATIIGGTSSQFVKGDGTLDSNTYALDNAVVHLSGSETITGSKIFSSTINSKDILINGDNSTIGGYVGLKQYSSSGFGGTGYSSIYALGQTSIYFNTKQTNGSNRIVELSTNLLSNNSTQQYLFPNSSGTFALTSDLHNAVTIGTANGLSLSTQVLSLGLASGSTNGALSSTDWTTFNNKQNALTNPITGTGTTNYHAKFTGSGTLGISAIYEDANGRIGIGNTIPSEKLEVSGNAVFNNNSNNGTTLKLISNSNTIYGDAFLLSPFSNAILSSNITYNSTLGYV